VDKIAVCLVTRFKTSLSVIRPYLKKAAIVQYGKVWWLDGGDIMNAATLVPVGDDRRDASYVRVSP